MSLFPFPSLLSPVTTVMLKLNLQNFTQHGQLTTGLGRPAEELEKALQREQRSGWLGEQPRQALSSLGASASQSCAFLAFALMLENGGERDLY